MYNTEVTITFNSDMSIKKVIIYDFSAHINIIPKISVSIIKRTLKEQSSQCIHISRNISKYKRTLKDPSISETSVMRLSTYIQMPVTKIKLKQDFNL